MRSRALIGSALLLSSALTHAADADVGAAIERLERSIAAQQAQIEQQRAQIAAQQAEIAALRAAVQDQDKRQALTEQNVAKSDTRAREQTPPAQDTPKFTFASNRPMISSADGRSTLALRAQVNLDVAAYGQDATGTLASDFRRGSVGTGANRENTAASDLSSGTNFRRARVGMEGIIARDFGYKFIAEFGGSGAETQTRINDMWVSYTGFAPFTVQMGAFAPNAGLDDSTSPDDLLFIERATPAELARALTGGDGRMALALRYTGTRAMGSLALTGGTAGEGETFDEQRAMVGRLALLALTSADYNVHLGAGGSHIFRAPDAGAGTAGGRYQLRWRDRPELRVDGTRLIDTGPIDAEAATTTGIEFAANWRNLFLQAEAFHIDVDRRSPTLDDPDFGGWYVEGSWVLTGENRRYNMATGSFQNVRPREPFSRDGGWGAWELAWRYSHADLNHATGLPGTAASLDAVRGGRQNILSLGLNWTINSNLRLMLDYLHVDVERLNPATAGGAPFGPAPATPPAGVDIGQELDIYALRMQLGF